MELVVSKAAEPKGGHWYDADGRPCHTVPKAKGDGQRSTTLRDARKLGLYPSVTTILQVLHKEMLQRWLRKQWALAAAELARMPEEEEKEWLKRVEKRASEYTETSAAKGTAIHATIERILSHGTLLEEEEHADLVRPVFTALSREGIFVRDVEAVVVNKQYGFAGTVDCVGVEHVTGTRHVIDFKTKDSDPRYKMEPFEGNSMQLAAYACSYFGEEQVRQGRVKCWNVFISRNEIGRVDWHLFEHSEIASAWRMFRATAFLWREQRAYDPRPKEFQHRN